MTPAVSIKLSALNIVNCKAVHDFVLPRDGMGWNGTVPDLMLLGGTNGSGKTTVLELIFDAWRGLAQYNHIDNKNLWQNPDVTRDSALTFETVGLPKTTVKFDSHAQLTQFPVGSDEVCAIRFHEAQGRMPTGHQDKQLLASLVKTPNWHPESACGTGVLYIPSNRNLNLPETQIKSPGKLEEHTQFAWRWTPPAQWQESVEAFMYSARWADLNAKDKGKPAVHFAAYQKAFAHFFGAHKTLDWTDAGDLVVRMADGTEHPLAALSSGEKQVLVLCAELYRRWRPGSLVLIDEPELHLHDHWLTLLWGFLETVQRERGGQVIVATQSNHLFRIAPAGCKAIIGNKEQFV